jgi:hypothetical protein
MIIFKFDFRPIENLSLNWNVTIAGEVLLIFTHA